MYKQNTYTQRGAENSLFQFCLTFSPIYLEEMKNYYSLSVSRTVSQLIMRVHKPKVEYKLALHEKPKGDPQIPAKGLRDPGTLRPYTLGINTLGPYTLYPLDPPSLALSCLMRFSKTESIFCSVGI